MEFDFIFYCIHVLILLGCVALINCGISTIVKTLEFKWSNRDLLPVRIVAFGIIILGIFLSILILRDLL